MRLFYSDPFTLPLPQGHRFPMEKYTLLREEVEVLVADGTHELILAPAATDAELATVHEGPYLSGILEGTLPMPSMRRIGFPWSKELVERSRRSVGGTVAAARAALGEGLSANLSGGTHHAFPHRGEGFCVFNDVAVATRVLQKEGLVDGVAILDLDVHQGNGTASIFANDPSVFTLSVHGANNYPFRKVPGDLDLALPDMTADPPYLQAVEEGLEAALGPPTGSRGHPPSLAFYLAGADPFGGDRLGRLAVSREGLYQRDLMVLDACQKRGIPLAVVMAGGYSVPIEDTVSIHLATVRAAVDRAGAQGLMSSC